MYSNAKKIQISILYSKCKYKFKSKCKYKYNSLQIFIRIISMTPKKMMITQDRSKQEVMIGMVIIVSVVMMMMMVIVMVVMMMMFPSQ